MAEKIKNMADAVQEFIQNTGFSAIYGSWQKWGCMSINSVIAIVIETEKVIDVQ